MFVMYRQKVLEVVHACMYKRQNIVSCYTTIVLFLFVTMKLPKRYLLSVSKGKHKRSIVVLGMLLEECQQLTSCHGRCKPHVAWSLWLQEPMTTLSHYQASITFHTHGYCQQISNNVYLNTQPDWFSIRQCRLTASEG